jgi:ditrans,polycis-polyprenyl diphosphate synthase
MGTYCLLHFQLYALMTCSDLLDEYGVRLNVLGKTSLLPLSVQRAIERAEHLTRHNKQ